MPDFDLDTFLPYRLNVLAEQVSKSFADRYRRAYGISVAEWRVVAHLAQGGPVSVREITERVALEKSRVSRAASRLEQAGYLRKAVNTQDRRLVALELTETGQAMMLDLAQMAAEYQRELCARLGADADRFSEQVENLLGDGT